MEVQIPSRLNPRARAQIDRVLPTSLCMMKVTREEIKAILNTTLPMRTAKKKLTIVTTGEQRRFSAVSKMMIKTIGDRSVSMREVINLTEHLRVRRTCRYVKAYVGWLL